MDILAILGMIVKSIVLAILEAREEQKNAVTAKSDNRFDVDEFFGRERM